MVKKIVLVLVFGFMINNCFAKSKQEKLSHCETILGAGMFNGLLEEVCGFEGGVKDNFLKLYDKENCRQLVPQKKVDQMAKDVLEDSKMRAKAYGEHTFCEVNMKPYVDLKDHFDRP